MTDKQTPDLQSCPFCGNDAPRKLTQMDESLWSHASVEWLTIVCDECDAQSVSSEVHEDVIAAWNRRAAARSLPSPEAAQSDVARWEYRFWRDGCGGEPVGWGAWEEVKPKGLQDMNDAVQEMVGYIRRGNRYELRALYTHPAAASPEVAGPTDEQRTEAEQVAAFFRLFKSSGHRWHDGRPLHIVAAELLEAKYATPTHNRRSPMAEGNIMGAAPLRTALDLTLTRDELAYLASFLTDDVEKDDEAVRLLIGDGHSGYGLYAAHPEYPEEGAILVKNLPAAATPTLKEAAAPAGWKLVPTEATAEMGRAGERYAEATHNRPKGAWWWRRLCEAMLAAAPPVSPSTAPATQEKPGV